jgi:hypothetical protein
METANDVTSEISDPPEVLFSEMEFCLMDGGKIAEFAVFKNTDGIPKGVVAEIVILTL